MKRSEINKALREMEEMAKACSFVLPPCISTGLKWRTLSTGAEEMCSSGSMSPRQMGNLQIRM